jgi:hypothetical protein
MNNSSSLDQAFIKNYTPLLNRFIEDVTELISVPNLPQPFLPVYGNHYQDAKDKILFYGIDTRRSCQLTDFIKTAQIDPDRTILNWFKEQSAFDDYDFTSWNAYKQGFWGFVLSFLKEFHNVQNLRDLYDLDKANNDERLGNILSSFAWANANSIEAYHVTAQEKGVTFSDWEKVKNASLVFDDPKTIIETLKPNLVIFLNWESNQGEDWLLNGFNIVKEEVLQEGYLWYYYFKNTNTHFFWTRHPTDQRFMGIKQEPLIKEIIEKYKLERYGSPVQ